MNFSLWFSPEQYHQLATKYFNKRWLLLMWSFLSFALFTLIESKIFNVTPSALVALALFILFFALQSLVLASFLFFFKSLPSNHHKADTTSAVYRFYRTIEWLETLLFSFLLPLPVLGFLYAMLMIVKH